MKNSSHSIPKTSAIAQADEFLWGAINSATTTNPSGISYVYYKGKWETIKKTLKFISNTFFSTLKSLVNLSAPEFMPKKTRKTPFYRQLFADNYFVIPLIFKYIHDYFYRLYPTNTIIFNRQIKYITVILMEI